ARRGKFDSIADKVDKHLLELDRIGLEGGPGRRASFNDDLDLCRFRHRTQHYEAFGEQRSREGRCTFNLELSRFDLRKIEHFFDESEEVHAALIDVPRILLVSRHTNGAQDLVLHHLAETNNRVKRST